MLNYYTNIKVRDNNRARKDPVFNMIWYLCLFNKCNKSLFSDFGRICWIFDIEHNELN